MNGFDIQAPLHEFIGSDWRIDSSRQHQQHLAVDPGRISASSRNLLTGQIREIRMDFNPDFQFGFMDIDFQIGRFQDLPCHGSVDAIGIQRKGLVMALRDDFERMLAGFGRNAQAGFFNRIEIGWNLLREGE